MRPQAIELAPRGDGARHRRVTLAIERDGGITLTVHEMGTGPGAEWGLDDDETTLSVPQAHIARLALALAAEVLHGGDDAVRRLARICEAAGAPCRISPWT